MTIVPRRRAGAGAARLSTLAIVILTTSAAVANGAPACPMTYAQFEGAIAHVDLDACPAELAGAVRFCRAWVGTDQVHVVAFAGDGDRCLVAMGSYDKDRFTLSITPAR